MSTTALLIVYCLAIIAASVLGGLVPILIRLTHTRLQIAISLTAGFMLGVAILHMIPHAVEAPGVAPMSVMTWALVGFLVMFFIERFFSFHTHEVAELDDEGKVLTSAQDLPEHDPKEHAHHHDHAHAHSMAGHTPGNKLSWTGAAIGLSLHSIIAGIALASAVASEAGGHSGHTSAAIAGLAVFMVIVLHKPLDALTVITLTASAGFAKPTRHLINGLFALAVPVGVVLFGLGLRQSELAESGGFVAYALAFSAGTFLCISLSDLLPELHFHSHDRGKLTAALILGVVLAYAMATAEHSMHDHDHGHGGHDHHSGHLDHDDHSGHEHSDDGHEDEHDHPGHAEPPALKIDPHEGHDHGEHAGHGHTDHEGHTHEDHAPAQAPKPDPHEGYDHGSHEGHAH
ncbi:ZIP family metal transporter [Algisphaera agarilytica]|uniref:Zinc and cadmium transporter n=1 Tax=Algisphaera agarilytica TaxID=1385975 RepID=A0A7X0HAU0_9BACT|nr:ZIP family metal transporter [Algisphaera agarilytica]MBB6430989.1 zinc and cadmium transporter [Algisphaera agarilytica]